MHEINPRVCQVFLFTVLPSSIPLSADNGIESRYSIFSTSLNDYLQRIRKILDEHAYYYELRSFAIASSKIQTSFSVAFQRSVLSKPIKNYCSDFVFYNSFNEKRQSASHLDKVEIFLGDRVTLFLDQTFKISGFLVNSFGTYVRIDCFPNLDNHLLRDVGASNFHYLITLWFAPKYA